VYKFPYLLIYLAVVGTGDVGGIARRNVLHPSWLAAVYNMGSGSWWTWDNDVQVERQLDPRWNTVKPRIEAPRGLVLNTSKSSIFQFIFRFILRHGYKQDSGCRMAKLEMGDVRSGLGPLSVVTCFSTAL